MLLLLLATSSLFEGVMKTIIYIIAYLAPILLGISVLPRENDREDFELKGLLKIGKSGLSRTLIFAPSVLLVIVTASLLTTLLMMLFGKENNTEIVEGAFAAIIVHAVLPSLFEEGAFRLLPMLFIGKRSPRGVVLLSALFFALMHTSFFSIPYAFIAGVVFMAIDLACGSVIPSVILHFLNNLIALFSLGAFGFSPELYIIFVILGALTLLSLPFLFFKRDEIKEEISAVFSRGEGIKIDSVPLVFAIPTLFIAITELLI